MSIAPPSSIDNRTQRHHQDVVEQCAASLAKIPLGALIGRAGDPVGSDKAIFEFVTVDNVLF
jgi:hypothetical protein